jgi:hypothetical protein
MYVFAKNERENISEEEREALLALGDEYMRLSAAKLDELVAAGVLIEVACHETEADEPHSH